MVNGMVFVFASPLQWRQRDTHPMVSAQRQTSVLSTMLCADVYRVLWRLWLALVTLSDLHNRGSPVRNLRRRVHALHDFRDGACRNAGVAISLLASRKCQRKCLMGLSTAQDRAASECPKATSSCGFQSVQAAPTSEFPHRRLRGEHCLHHLRCRRTSGHDRRDDVRRMLLYGVNSRCLPGPRFVAAAGGPGVWQATATHLSPLKPASWSDSAVWRRPF